MALASTSYSQHEGHNPPPRPKQQPSTPKPSPSPTPTHSPAPVLDNKPAQQPSPEVHKHAATPLPTPVEGHRHVTPPAPVASPDHGGVNTGGAKHAADAGTGLLLMTDKEMGIRIGASNSNFLSTIVYTCAEFDENKAVQIVKEFFQLSDFEAAIF